MGLGRTRLDVDGRQDPRRAGRVENLALVPASLLPYKTTYQRLANQLPWGAVLVVLPTEDSTERRGLQEAAERLRTKGHAIATLSVDEILAQASRRRVARPAAPAPAAMDPPPVAVPAPLEPAVDPEAITELLPAASTVPPFTLELRLVRIDAGTSPARFEIYQWQPTLWGGVALVRLRGILGQPPQLRTLVESDTPQLTPDLIDRVQRRLRAGYGIVDWQ